MENQINEISTKIQNEGQAQILDFVSFRKNSIAKKKLHGQVQAQAYEMLKVVQGLVCDYEAQMTQIAAELDGPEFTENHGCSAAEQISQDLRRLHDFSAALEAALNGGAATLGLAAQALTKSGNEEVIETLDYILSSDYVGFQAIAKILEAVSFTESNHHFNIEAIVAIYTDLETTGFKYGASSLESLCMEDAMAI